MKTLIMTICILAFVSPAIAKHVSNAPPKRQPISCSDLKRHDCRKAKSCAWLEGHACQAVVTTGQH